MVGEGRDTHALPLVAIYLLGHNVGDIEEPVLYVQHETYDYEGRRVTKGLPDPFVDSLTHNSIIVQIPRLHGQVNTRLDKVLSVFDQTYKSKDNHQLLHIDDSIYAGDAEMEHIIHRLLMAATDANVRQDMNVEDEYFSIIEKRDTEIMMRDRQLAEQSVRIAEQGAQLKEQGAQLKQKDTIIEQQEQQLCNSIRMLLMAKMAPETIAASLGIDLEKVLRELE